MNSKRRKDLHIVRYFSSLITISDGKVTKVTKPTISHCPLAGFFYKGLKRSGDLPLPRLKDEIKKVIEGKIEQFGFCSKKRLLWDNGESVPYGASEIIAHGLKNKIIDSSVIVCDGAGTVVVSIPRVVQGIGARMHSVLRTSVIPEVIDRLHQYGCHTINNSGAIDQKRGVIEAAKEGYRNIAVTVNAYQGESLNSIRALEKQYGVSLIILAICTTGISGDRISEIEKYADLVWACRSREVRNVLCVKAIEILSNAAPVYVLTQKGKIFIASYSPNIFRMRKKTERRAVP
jgi:putative methanogenesis marker protein 8